MAKVHKKPVILNANGTHRACSCFNRLYQCSGCLGFIESTDVSSQETASGIPLPLRAVHAILTGKLHLVTAHFTVALLFTLVCYKPQLYRDVVLLGNTESSLDVRSDDLNVPLQSNAE
jgi:hypothetical protein